MDELCKKLSKGLGLLRHISPYLKQRCKSTFYNATIKPVMLYLSPIWSSCSKELLPAMSLRRDTLSFIPQGSVELVEVLECFTGQILKFSCWTQIPTNHLNLKNYCFTLTIVLHVLLLFPNLPFLWRVVLRMLLFFNELFMLLERLASCTLFLWIFHATETPSVLYWEFTLKWRFQFPC